MSDWNYIAGEDVFGQDFAVINRSNGEGFDGDAVSVTSADITIKNSDLSALTPPIQNLALGIVTLNPLVVRHSVTTSTVPQTPGYYIVIIRIIDVAGRILKTFELDLRVLFGG